MKQITPLSAELTRTFLRLMQVAVGTAVELDTQPDEQGWEALCHFARKQSVLGMAYRAVMSLPSDQQPPKKVRMTLAYSADRIERGNADLNSKAASISEWVAELGLHSCVLKGQGTATLYPEPGLRQCGDIDLWVSGSREDILKAVRTRWKTGPVFYHHSSIRPFADKTEVEIHFTPSWMNNPFTNRKLQRYFGKESATQFAAYMTESGFSVPTLSFNCVYGAVHIYRHLLQEGIGIRQIMDYQYILRSSSPEELRAAGKTLRGFRMGRFAAALMYVEKELFNLDDRFFVCAPDERMGRFLLEEILISGNFGRDDPRYSYSASDGLLRRAGSRMGRLVHYFRIAPREVFWAPGFKLWQMVWRRQFCR